MINVDVKKSMHTREEWALWVSFPYNNRILEVVRSFPNKWWHAASKVWELPFSKLPTLLDRLPDQEFDISGEYVDLTTSTEPVEIPQGFEFKTKPFDHQLEAFQYGLEHDRWFLGDEQGLGKTKQAIDIAVAKKLQRGYKHCLIICGVNGLKWNWLNEISIHSNETGHILGMRGNKVAGNAAKDQDLLYIDQIKSYFLITNVESLRDENIAAHIQELCDKKVIGLVVIDEIHKCKNPTSQQGKGILKIKSECRIAMSGTPLMNNPLDLFIIFKWLGYENHSFYQFRKYYCEMGGFGGYEVIGYKHLDELSDQLDDIMIRRRKEDVLDLPEKLYIDEYVEMSTKQKKVYDEVTADIKENIDQIKTSPNPLAALIRMRQATGYTGILSSIIQESAKLDRLEELVQESRENGKKVVIFSNWTQMTDAIYERLEGKGYGVSVITGETKDERRQDIVNLFQSPDGRCNVLIGTIGAMGTGLTLTAGTVEIFMDEPWTMAAKEQAEDRCHRVGTSQNVTIYTLMCKNTIDERIHELIQKKGAIAELLVDGNVDGNKAEIFDYLLG